MKVQVTKCYFFERKGKFWDYPAKLVTDPGESNLHDITAARNVIVVKGKSLNNYLPKSICKILILV